ncbi:hypothetical protein [Dokdonia sp. Hel_I_53]|nr:hypothetical protein [Dokdonia sp. Hel_I_53]TVZ51490.1 hypothetical protein OD90_0633 [Dokdonia sp. Hel_I_53]
MKPQNDTTSNPKTNKALGIYTIFMVSLSISYIVTTMVHNL